MSLVIIGILASVAVPSFSRMTTAHQLADVAEKIRQDILYARSESIKQNTNIHFTITTGTNWCYGFTDTSLSCSCSSSNSCQISSSEKAVKSSEYSNITLSKTGALNDDVYFTPVRGALVRNNNIPVNNGSITVSQHNLSATIEINALGHASICSNSLAQFSNCQ